ncbi:MAG: hypothetical protein R3A46_03280 [Thermomicrobiales bacterium]
MLRNAIKTILAVVALTSVVGYASSFTINAGNPEGSASISSGGISVEGCDADVEVDINGADRNGRAEFDQQKQDFVIQSIDIDATRGDSDCRDHTGLVWVQLLSTGDAYGPVIGPEKLAGGEASFDDIGGKKLLAGEVTHVQVMIELNAD